MRDVVFDIGNVILFFDYQIFVRRIEADCACSRDELLARLEKPSWELEARALPAPEFFRVAAECIGYRGSLDAFVAAWQEIFEPNEPVIRFIGRLKERGHRLFLLSNTNPWHAEYFLARYPVFGLFDGHVFSHEEGCAKPEPRIYEIAISRFGVVPEETIYIDDRLENITAGLEAGFVSIHYQGQDLESTWRTLSGSRPR